MSVPAAYATVVLIWATTPLAIKWSSEGAGFLYGVSGRMLLGAVLCLLLVRVLGAALPWHRRAWMTYLAGAVAIYGAMVSVYWGAQYIQSGLISVLFGLTPIFTSTLAALWLQERSLTGAKFGGMICGVAGLAVIFRDSLSIGDNAVFGIAAVLFSVLLHSASTVWVKRLGAALPAVSVTTGSLLLALPLYLLTWLAFDGSLPDAVPVRTSLSIIYLGVFGSFLGFLLYYYLLRHVAASSTALITLLTPVLALLLGQTLNGEVTSVSVWMGTAAILLGLALYQWGDLALHRLQAPD